MRSVVMQTRKPPKSLQQAPFVRERGLDLAALSASTGVAEVGMPRCWPSVADVVELQLVARTFPGSDFRHGVVSPLQLLLGQTLARCPVRCPRDLGVGLVLAQLAASLAAESEPRRVVPEAVVRDY